MSDIVYCPSCEAGLMEHFYEVRSVPANSCILLTSRQDALAYPRGDIRLGFCPQCGFVSNTAFDQTLTQYDGRYEESQEYSPTYNAFHKRLAERLVERHNLRGKKAIEIGCGQGEFLNLLCDFGLKGGIGFDPAYVPDQQQQDGNSRVHIISDVYSDKYANYNADIYCCKMTLEHIPFTDAFMHTVGSAIQADHDTLVFFQVPEATRILRDCAFEDIYYEHCSYFSPGSLSRLFQRHGFAVQDISTDYDDQYLTIEARPGDITVNEQPPVANDLEQLKQYVTDFPAKFKARREEWISCLNDMRRDHLKVVLWGSGSKATSFLTTLNANDIVDYVVDINPARQGSYIAGTGQEIVAPAFLRDFKPDIVIIMNRIYRDEIGADLKAMGLEPSVFAL